MGQSKTQFDNYLEEEINRCRGVYFPVKTGLLRRLLTRKASVFNLHPNPEDEFCDPKIGPSYKIISEYQQMYVDALKSSYHFYEDEPIVVERLHPDGYRILNGHHRWAAVMRIGQDSIPIRIVNMTHEEDVKRILEHSVNTKRATLDLDEVIFRSEGDGPLEKPAPFPWNRLVPERMRLGVPALFHFLSKRGYDIWVYSAKYYSTDSIQKYFEKYHVHVDGVMTATAKRAKSSGESSRKINKMIADKYRITLHIDNEAVIRSVRDSRDYREYELKGTAETWSQAVMDAVEDLENQTEECDRQP